MRASRSFGATGRFDPMPSDAAGLARLLAARRNDLTGAALNLLPEIAQVRDRLARLPGATSFALFADRAAALAAHAVLARLEPSLVAAARRAVRAAHDLTIADGIALEGRLGTALAIELTGRSVSEARR